MFRTLRLAVTALLVSAGALCAQGIHIGIGQRPTSPKAPTAGESCIAGKDLVVQALEKLRADSPASDVLEANQLLKRALDLCAESGEAWYFRSLVEGRLNHAPQAAYAMRQAQMFPSEALHNGINPFILATPAPNRTAPLGPIQQRWALIVGVGTFSDPNINQLAYTSKDAEAFRDLLLDPHRGGFSSSNVRMLTNDGATLEAIKEDLNWLARSAQPDDLVVVYFASHGSSRAQDTAGANYILTHDTKVGQNIDPDMLYATALPMVQLADDVATRIRSLRTAIFLDTCYSGGAIHGKDKLIAPGVATASVSKSTLQQISQGSGRIIFAASSNDEESQQSDKLAHGYFTYYLLQSLKAHPDMSLSQIFPEVQKNVSAQVDADSGSLWHQTPVMSRSEDDSDFAIGVKSSAVASLATAARGGR